MRHCCWLTVFVCCGTASLTGAAGAQSNVDAHAAQRLFVEGLKSLEHNDWTQACAKFEESAALEPRASSWVKIALCRQHEGRFVASWEALQRARKLNASEPAAFRPDLEREIRDELAKVPVVRIEMLDAPPGVKVYLDQRRLDPASLPGYIPLELGRHEVRAEAPGYEIERLEFELAGAQAKTVTVVMRMLSDPAAIGPTMSSVGETRAKPQRRGAPRFELAAAPTSEPSLGSRTIASMTLGGIGALGLLSGAVLGWRTLSLVQSSNQYCTYPDGSCDSEGVRLREEARSSQTAAFIVGGVGAAALGAGLALYLTQPARKSPHPQRSLFVAPAAIPGAGLSAGANF